ncbi:D-erythronate dehydrogenase [Pseudaestuariivita atlantica]|uniref:NAD-dependent dehydratase n=1 Tax=Pseudaestuariivita atlantica TaxID=1317121 RepID=A0A0L1JUA7_9RHOB|nr:D-erythronate dehydrogenase [Pseudaestuariivita atlantica]KNG94968.1 NAD-dependent dehydratase [Pseudaestuariivita atlantica]
MKILITGGGGLVGQKLARRLAERGTLRGAAIDEIVLADIVEPAPVDAPFPVSTRVGNIAEPAEVAGMIDDDTTVIYHLAAILSGHAEVEFDHGIAVNLMGTLHLLQRAREIGTAPVFVYASSIATLGGEVPDPIEDWTATNPQTSYGTQKAAGELLLNDFSRKGFVQGRGVRLPTISVRPGKPNRAASSFMSSIIREPLNGQEAICPVGLDFQHYYLSPRMCVENLVRVAEVEQEALGMNVNMTMPGLTHTIGDLIDALRDVAGPEPAQRIRFESQPEIEKIVMGWRYAFNPAKALALGLAADNSFRDNVRYYLEDDKPSP